MVARPIFDRLEQREDLALAQNPLGELLLFALDIRDILIEPRELVAVGAHAGLELMAPGGQIRKRGGELGEQGFGIGQCRFGRGHALIDAGALFDARLDLFLQLAFSE